jgi:hypothetical protein
MRFHRDAFVNILDRSDYESRAAFAIAVGISAGTLHDIASTRPRRQPSDELIRRLARELKVPVTAIICDPDEAVA